LADFSDGPSDGCQVGCVVTMANTDFIGEGASNGSAESPAAYRIGGNLRPPRKVRDAAPEYPEIARRIRVSGEVVIDCLIDEQGHVREATVLHGHPLLAPAAVAAVERWAYAPSLLNGVPVQVLMTVTVHFQLK
jgi:TonB family protein